jgi:hypothetical protein
MRWSWLTLLGVVLLSAAGAAASGDAVLDNGDGSDAPLYPYNMSSLLSTMGTSLFEAISRACVVDAVHTLLPQALNCS